MSSTHFKRLKTYDHIPESLPDIPKQSIDTGMGRQYQCGKLLGQSLGPYRATRIS